MALLRAENLSRQFTGETGAVIHAVTEVSLQIEPGERVALVGESGSGKSTLARLLVGLEAPTHGEVWFAEQNLAKIDREALRRLRAQMQIVFQDPVDALNPRMTVADLIAEPLIVHKIGSEAERTRRVDELLAQVGLEANHRSRKPTALSGGQRQRVALARAVATKPKLLVADEPLSALDSLRQAEIVALLGALQKETQTALLFVSHDLEMVRRLCDRVLVMHQGRIVEAAGTEALFSSPQHPHTQALLAARLSL